MKDTKHTPNIGDGRPAMRIAPESLNPPPPEPARATRAPGEPRPFSRRRKTKVEEIPREKLLKLIEVAELLGIVGLSKNPERTIMEMARRGELQSVRVSRWLMIHPKSVEKYLNPAGGLK